MPKLSIPELVTVVTHFLISTIAGALVAVNPGLRLSSDQQVAAGSVIAAYLTVATNVVLSHLRWLRTATGQPAPTSTPAPTTPAPASPTVAAVAALAAAGISNPTAEQVAAVATVPGPAALVTHG